MVCNILLDFSTPLIQVKKEAVEFDKKFCVGEKDDEKCKLFVIHWGEMQTAWLTDKSTAEDFCKNANMCDSHPKRYPVFTRIEKSGKLFLPFTAPNIPYLTIV